MTQEELDAMMAGDVDSIDDEPSSEESSSKKDEKKSGGSDSYRINPEESWPPPPPTEDHKMVSQLDDVTRDSELKATEVFDKLEAINEILMNAESASNEVLEDINYNIELFALLCDKFPNVEKFKEAKEKNDNIKEKIETVINDTQMGEDEVMMTMDFMQYQDIHRQKIERVINVMRALSRYMNSLFEGKKDDSKRVGSAVHIEGDTSTENVVDNDEIEALIASLGAGKK